MYTYQTLIFMTCMSAAAFAQPIMLWRVFAIGIFKFVQYIIMVVATVPMDLVQLLVFFPSRENLYGSGNCE